MWWPETIEFEWHKIWWSNYGQNNCGQGGNGRDLRSTVLNFQMSNWSNRLTYDLVVGHLGTRAWNVYNWPAISFKAMCDEWIAFGVYAALKRGNPGSSDLCCMWCLHVLKLKVLFKKIIFINVKDNAKFWEESQQSLYTLNCVCIVTVPKNWL